jgi:hypothetical protein
MAPGAYPEGATFGYSPALALNVGLEWKKFARDRCTLGNLRA